MQTENDWLQGHDAIAMAAFLPGRFGDRKLRLIACACCGRLDRVVEYDWAVEALAAAEALADDRLAPAELDRARQRVLDATAWAGEWADETPEENIARAVRALLQPKAALALRETLDALERAAHLTKTGAAALEMSLREMKRQAAIIREVIGNPFRAVEVAESWRRWNGGCLVALAAEIYQDRKFEDVPILGDMLEDAGCTEPTLLDHCRLDRDHALGCWLLDSVLGKS